MEKLGLVIDAHNPGAGAGDGRNASASWQAGFAKMVISKLIKR